MQLVQVRWQIVRRVQAMDQPVQNVTMDSIQMELNVKHVQQFLNVRRVHRQQGHVQHVQVDISFQMEDV